MPSCSLLAGGGGAVGGAAGRRRRAARAGRRAGLRAPVDRHAAATATQRARRARQALPELRAAARRVAAAPARRPGLRQSTLRQAGRQGGRARAARRRQTRRRAGSLVLVDTGKEHAAAPSTAAAALVCAGLRRALPGDRPAASRCSAARDAAQAGAKARSLADDPVYDARRSTALPADRVADGWASRDGVRRLLAPQGGLLGAAGVLLDQPALTGAGVGAHRPRRRARGSSCAASSTRKVRRTRHVQALRADAAGAGARGRDRLPRRQRPAHRRCSRVLAAAGPRPPASARCCSARGQAARPAVRRPADRDVLALFARRGRRSSLTTAVPAPVLTVIGARQGRDTRARRSPSSRRRSRGCSAQERRRFQAANVDAAIPLGVLKAGPISLAYAVFDGRLVVSTATCRDRRGGARGRPPPTRRTPFKAVTGNTPETGHLATLPRLHPAPAPGRADRPERLARLSGGPRRPPEGPRGRGLRRRAPATNRPRSSPSRSHEPVRRQRVPLHLRVRHRRPPRQGRRPDLRRRPRRRPEATTPTAASPARRSSTPASSSSPARSRPTRTSTSRRSPARRSARSATPTPTSASPPTPAPSSTRSTSSRPTSPRASTRPTRRAPTPPTTTSSTSPARATRA